LSNNETSIAGIPGDDDEKICYDAEELPEKKNKDNKKSP